MAAKKSTKATDDAGQQQLPLVKSEAKKPKTAAAAKAAPEKVAAAPKAAGKSAAVTAPKAAAAKVAAEKPAAVVAAKAVVEKPVAVEAPKVVVETEATEATAFEKIATLDSAGQTAQIERWLASKNAAAIGAIARRDDAPSAARKAARRAVQILKSRGVTIPEPAAVFVALQRPVQTIEARMTFPDAEGVQLWWITRVAATGAAEFIEVTTSDRAGLAKLQRGSSTAGGLRQHWSGWNGRIGRAPVEVPIAYARARLSAARAISVARKQVLPFGIDSLGEWVGPIDVAVRSAHPLDGEDLVLPKAEDAVKARIDVSQTLHAEPEFRAWLPESLAGEAMLRAIDEKLRSLDVSSPPTPETLNEIVKTTVHEAADAYFDDVRKGLVRTRLKDAAWSLLRADRVQAAIDAMLVGEAIARAGIVSDRASEIPFVQTMFYKLLALAQARSAQAQAKQGRGVDEPAASDPRSQASF